MIEQENLNKKTQRIVTAVNDQIPLPCKLWPPADLDVLAEEEKQNSINAKKFFKLMMFFVLVLGTTVFLIKVIY